jgi:hypothetical protein
VTRLLQQRFRGLYEAGDLPALSAMAKELGFTISKEDYDAAVAEDLKKLTDSGHLSQADLQAIVGGAGGPGSQQADGGTACALPPSVRPALKVPLACVEDPESATGLLTAPT